ncbi:hypothetical protein EMWEY_00059290, partial [Eimeria maxima]
SQEDGVAELPMAFQSCAVLRSKYAFKQFRGAIMIMRPIPFQAFRWPSPVGFLPPSLQSILAISRRLLSILVTVDPGTEYSLVPVKEAKLVVHVYLPDLATFGAFVGLDALNAQCGWTEERISCR